MSVVALRVDGGKDIGMGHIMRTMVLANDFKRDGEVRRVFYITKNEPSTAQLSALGFSNKTLINIGRSSKK